jgi:Tfp pilus assembly protein PilF
MKNAAAKTVRLVLAAAMLSGAWCAGPAGAQPGIPSSDAEQYPIAIPEARLQAQSTVDVMPAGSTRWIAITTTNRLLPFDRLRTGPNGRVTILWSAESAVPLGPLTEIEVLPAQDQQALPGLHVLRGILSFFHRDRPGRIRVITQGATAGIEGTEFVLAVDSLDNQERTTLSLIDGKVLFANDLGSLVLTNGQQAVAEPAKAPRRTAGFVVNNVLQWCFYYPAVLDLADLGPSAGADQALDDSLTAYRAGDLLQALANYPFSRQPRSDAEALYRAALLLSVGRVEDAEAALAQLRSSIQGERPARLALALRTLIAAVKRQPNPSTLAPELSTELLAASYYKQSLALGDESLNSALALARQASTRSPNFGFAWERVAELEFAFGHTAAARDDLERALDLTPRNPEGLALKGFLLAAENKPRQAIDWFDRALAVDAALGNAWLGRGLCRIRRGDTAGGREDLLAAAAMEPQRALLRSYLGKAFADAGEERRATKELQLGRQLDPKDPTGWLYSALLKQQQNRINEAITDLEKSEELNDDRSLFRSRLLLDEDRAVSSANLASIYRDAGMTDVSVREAAQAVTYDYANSSAHLFLSDAYNDLRDPTRFDLRYETAWFNELLLANLLSPVGGGRLSQNVSQQEYSRLFQSDGFGVANSALARSDGVFTELASQYGTFGRTSYAFDLDYQHDDGVRVNNDLASIEWYTTLKQQVTDDDTVLAQVKYENYHSGDNFQYYDPREARPYYRYDEYQDPIVVGAWHHQWGPGMHTLLFGGRLITEQHFSDQAAPQLLLLQNGSGALVSHDAEPFDVSYNNQVEVYTAEAEQIFQWDRVTLLAGGRWQSGSIQSTAVFTNPPAGLVSLFETPPARGSSADEFDRLTGYGYLTVEPVERLWLTGGLAYDYEKYPADWRNPPLSPGEDERTQIGPKAAVVWSPLPQATLRGMFSRSLGGAGEDENYRLEPTQLAGFLQSYRSLISESVVGSVTAPEYQLFGVALDLKFPTRTYAGIQVQRMETSVRSSIGYFSLLDGMAPFVPNATQQDLDYWENSIQASVNQLVGDMTVFGLSYKFDQVQLKDALPQVPISALPSARQTLDADLHQATLYALVNHPSGFFARAEARWYHQSNSGYQPAEPGDDFFEENLYVGYRLKQRRVEILLGILDLGNQDYHLNPLTIYDEFLPRKRTYEARLNFIF